MSIEDATYVSFDLETTGFSVIHDGITEFGAVKIKKEKLLIDFKALYIQINRLEQEFHN